MKTIGGICTAVGVITMVLGFALLRSAKAEVEASQCSVVLRNTGAGSDRCPSGYVVTAARLIPNTEIIQLDCALISVRCEN